MPELEEQYGIKRICQNCAARYYDLNKDPAVCPSCGTEYDPEAVMRSRRGRVAAAAVASAKEEVAPEVELEDAPKSTSGDEDEEEDEVVAVALDEVDEDTLEDGETDLVVNDDGEVSLDDEFGEDDEDAKVDDDTLLDDDDELVDGALPVEGLETGLDEDS